MSGQNCLIDGIAPKELAQRFGTPVYVYDETAIRKQCREYLDSFKKHYPKETRIAYAAKAFLVKEMCRLIQEEGLYLDCASLGELLTAKEAQFPSSRIYLHGNCKSEEELETAVADKLHRVIVDNTAELRKLNKLAIEKKTKIPILLRITPGVEAHTHDYIKTGHLDTKFGIPLSDGQAESAVHLTLKMPAIQLRGFHCHIGSQIFDLEGFVVSVDVMFDFLAALRKKTGHVFEELDMGGGLGIRYIEEHNPPSIEEYAKTLSRAIKETATKHSYPLPILILEPGRSIVGEAGVTLYSIRYIKKISKDKTFVLVDGGLSDNPRPALYGAHYQVFNASRPKDKANFLCTVAGKHCESDVLFRDVLIAPPREGDILLVRSTGAYHHSMASNYNRYPRPGAVFVNGGKARLVYKRETIGDLIKNDV